MTRRQRPGEEERTSGDLVLDLFAPPASEPARRTRPLAPTISEGSTPPHRGTRGASHAGSGAAPGTAAESAVGVGALTHIAREILEGAVLPLWVRGEVSDFKAHRNGHWYFCLRDATAQLRCVVWARDRRQIPAPPDDGMQVAALGRLTVYEARGEMQLAVTRLTAEGDGLWRKALELTRARLEADGLLRPERKRSLARCPRRVAVVTSLDGAALHDIVAVIRRRCPTTEIVVVPARVQGDGAVNELVAALERVSRWGGAETVIVGRGGGAREDLWAFNDERVARAVAACAIPTISAVGHEVDITLCDLVADFRAPTPSAAAEAAVPVLASELATLGALHAGLRSALERRIGTARERLGRGAGELRASAERLLEARRLRLDHAAGRLDVLSPLGTLRRGYAVVRHPDGAAITSASHATPGSALEVVLRDGTLRVTVDEVLPLVSSDSLSSRPGPVS